MKFRFDCYVREWFVCLLGRDQMNYYEIHWIDIINNIRSTHEPVVAMT